MDFFFGLMKSPMKTCLEHPLLWAFLNMKLVQVWNHFLAGLSCLFHCQGETGLLHHHTVPSDVFGNNLIIDSSLEMVFDFFSQFRTNFLFSFLLICFSLSFICWQISTFLLGLFCRSSVGLFKFNRVSFCAPGPWCCAFFLSFPNICWQLSTSSCQIVLSFYCGAVFNRLCPPHQQPSREERSATSFLSLKSLSSSLSKSSLSTSSSKSSLSSGGTYPPPSPAMWTRWNHHHNHQITIWSPHDQHVKQEIITRWQSLGELQFSPPGSSSLHRSSSTAWKRWSMWSVGWSWWTCW